MHQSHFLITDFSNLAHQKWQITNDSVMGGRSDSGFQINAEGHAVFLGRVSLENNGGFASVKNHEPLNLTGYRSIRITLKGDGKRYSFRLQTGTAGQPDRWSYEYRFDTKNGDREIVDLPLNEFRAVFRGRSVPDAPALNASQIMRYGFLISDKQEGPFRLEIEKIEAV
ncbi:CIA30 family protein [Rhodohalobacter mucosus]|uniref:CIA30 family protein n=1 Tax=Rhodohalobacter mucosus TaxID=2079485 RepID=A0A316TUY0_9BACT|nr:CIA30 family protein [Rhodohalobacter mucosus]PWN06895.1 CIA30 family protein [Rhodohalobacter mucosus]